jgi:hypothetical protein
VRVRGIEIKNGRRITSGIFHRGYPFLTAEREEYKDLGIFKETDRNVCPPEEERWG